MSAAPEIIYRKFYMKQTYETGLRGEDAAEFYLTREHGMICLERRYRTKTGEIDLILLDQETVVFAEVKTRQTGDLGNGLAAVNIRKQKRIVNAALLFLMRRKWMGRSIRFDVIEICRGEILYVPNAFQPYGYFYH